MPAHAGIQYAAALAVESLTLWNTGSPRSRGRRPLSRAAPTPPRAARVGGRGDKRPVVREIQMSNSPLLRSSAFALCASVRQVELRRARDACVHAHVIAPCSLRPQGKPVVSVLACPVGTCGTTGRKAAPAAPAFACEHPYTAFANDTRAPACAS